MLGKITPDSQQNLFKTRLTDLINLGHPLVKLSQEVSWDKMEFEFQNLYSEQGRPSIPMRKIAGLLLWKEMFKESDESVVERWMENALLAGVGYNLKLRLNQIKEQIVFWLNKLFNFLPKNNILIFVEIKNCSF